MQWRLSTTGRSIRRITGTKLSPQQIQDVVNHADDVHPGGVADQLGAFYAQHRTLISTLGGVAATVAMMKMKDQLSGQ